MGKTIMLNLTFVTNRMIKNENQPQTDKNKHSYSYHHR